MTVFVEMMPICFPQQVPSTGPEEKVGEGAGLGFDPEKMLLENNPRASDGLQKELQESYIKLIIKIHDMSSRTNRISARHG